MMLDLWRFFVLLVVVAMSTGGHLGAATFNVTSTVDMIDVAPGDGWCDANSSPSIVSCTLRAAIMEANALSGPDVVKLAADIYTLSLTGSGETGGDLDVEDDLRIEGVPGAIIDADNLDRVLDVTEALALELEDVVLRNGETTQNGGCLHALGELTLRRVEVVQCQGGSQGGGIYWSGIGDGERRLLVEDSWIHYGRASNGGGMYMTGQSVAVAVISRSTISGNQATFAYGGGVNSVVTTFINSSTVVSNGALKDGGGLFFSGGRLQINGSTVYRNHCDLDGNGDGVGGGVWAPGGSKVARNSIIAKNFAYADSGASLVPDDCWASFDSEGYNLLGTPSVDCTGFGPASNDLVGPDLDPDIEDILSDNGGPTPTLLPNPTSLVIDSGNPSGCLIDEDFDWNTDPTPATTDQRGYERAVDGDGASGPRCDIGATEFGATEALFEDDFESGDLNAWDFVSG